jgi:hypothetical protein
VAKRSTGLNIVITGDAKNASAAMKRLQGDVETLDDRTARYKDTLQSAVGLYVGATFFRGAVDEAASLAEAQNTVKVVFEESSDSVQTFAEDATEAYGISEKAALQAANGYGLLLTNMDVGNAKAAEMSQTLVGLASDLAAFADLPLDQALGAIRSGLSGESEPLKAFGVRLTEAKIKSEAMALGLHEGTGAISDQARAMATYAIIIEDTAKAQGTYARESDGLKQQTQQLTAEWDNAKAKLGAELIPAMQTATSVAGGMLDIWSKLPGEIQLGVVALGGVAYFGPKIASGLKSGGEALTNLRLGMMGVTQSGAGASNAIGGLVNKVGQMPGAFGAASFATVLVVGALYDAAEESKRLEANVDSLLGAIQAGESPLDAFREKLAKTFAGIDGGFDLGWSGRSFGAVMEGFGYGIDEVSNAITGSREEWSAFIVEIAKNPKIPPEVYEDLVEIRAAFDGATDKSTAYNDAQKALGITEEGTADAIDGTTGALEREETVLERLARVSEENRKRVEAEWAAKERMRDATEQVADAQAELAEAQRAANGDSDEYRSALDSIADAQEALADSHKGVAEAQERVNEARAAAADRLEELRRRVDELRQSEERANLTTRQAQQAARDALADPTLTKLEKEDAQLKAREAAQAERDLKTERADAARELAEAQRRGIDGDKDVIAAKDGVAEAERRVRDAADQVREAQRRAADVIQEAKGRVVEATKRVEEALKNEVESWANLAEAQWGAAAGTIAYQAGIDALLKKIDANSPFAEALRQRKQDLHDLGWAALAGVPGGIGLAAQWQAGTGAGPQVTIVNQGTAEQVRRATFDTLWGLLDGAAKKAG